MQISANQKLGAEGKKLQELNVLLQGQVSKIESEKDRLQKDLAGTESTIRECLSECNKLRAEQEEVEQQLADSCKKRADDKELMQQQLSDARKKSSDLESTRDSLLARMVKSDQTEAKLALAEKTSSDLQAAEDSLEKEVRVLGARPEPTATNTTLQSASSVAYDAQDSPGADQDALPAAAPRAQSHPPKSAAPPKPVVTDLSRESGAPADAVAPSTSVQTRSAASQV